jgi:2-hydroxycyclohexanecarboxyl-CoA dehydrogenase
LRGLARKTAIVTGGGQGIGRAIVLRLAEEGCNVALFDLKPEVAEETAKTAKGGQVRVYHVDVGDRAAVDAAVEKVAADLGPVWLLVNNAGWDKPMPFLKTDRDLWDKIIRINLYGPLNMHHAVCPGMVDRGEGRVVNIASDAARVGTSDEAVYSACKGGLIAFTKSVARELARKGVLLNAVCRDRPTPR